MDEMANELNKPASAQPPSARLGFMLYRCGLAVSRGYERALLPLQTAPVEAGVLSALAYSGPNHVRGLARLLGLGRQTIVNVTRRLESAKLVGHASSEADARLLLFSITAEGRRKLAIIEGVVSAFDDHLRKIVGEQKETDLINQLRKIVEAPFLAYEE